MSEEGSIASLTILPRPDLRRILLVAMALPAAIVLVDSLTWMQPGIFSSSILRAWFFFPWLVVKTALLSWCAGQFLGSTFYGWLIFFWCQALLDVHTTLGTYRLGSSETDGLAHTLISAQIGFLALWAILGKTAWGWRFTCILLAAAGILAQVATLHDDWNTEAMPVILALAAGILVIICVALRLSGFQLLSPSNSTDASNRERTVVQFGMKHMLLWATALAPLMLAVRGFDVAVFQQLGLVDARPAATIALWTALVILAAIWLAVGQGMIALRITAMALAVAAAGTGMFVQSMDLKILYGEWPQQQVIRIAVTMGKLWYAWFALTGALLAAMLLFLRATGYRLAKLSRRPA